jgi:uncharacterized membrane protein YadS
MSNQTYIIIYLVSLVLSWLYIREAHSRRGRHSYISPPGLVIFLILMPITNSALAIMWILWPPYKISTPKLSWANITRAFLLLKKRRNGL